MSRNTVGVAYDRLVSEGFVRSRVGARTWVSAEISPRERARPLESPLRPRPVWNAISELMAAQLRSGAVGNAAHIGGEGLPALRAAIARHVGVSRAVLASAEDVFITTGGQQAMDLVARVLLEPDDVVAVEDPGYPPPHRAFASLGARVVGVPVDAEGLVVDALPADAKLVYVTPAISSHSG